jgi:vitamin B12 transporter
MRTEGKTDFDGIQTELEFVNQVVGIHGSMELTDNWRTILRLGQSRDDNDNFLSNGKLASRFDTTRWNVSWLNELQLHDEHQLVLGSDYRFDEVEGTTDFLKTSRYDVGVFAEMHSRLFDYHFFNAAVRWDKNQAFGDNVTGSFGWRFNWDYGLSLFASFGNAFKAPSFNDLYFKDSFGSLGNPDLEPEESTTFEVGLAGNHDWFQWEFRAYHTNIDNLIVWKFNPVTFGFSPENLNKAQIDGIETEIGAEILGWNNKLGFQFLSPKDRTTNLRLPRRAEKILSYDLSRSFGSLDVATTVMARGDSFNDSRNNKKISGFVTVDLRAAYHINKNWTLSGKLNNLLNKQYQLVDTFNTANRNFFFSIHYNS